MAMRIESDGTPQGTRVYDEDGNQIDRVVSIQRQGPRTYITRYAPRDIEIEGLGDGDFHLAVRGDYQPVRV